MCKMISSSLYTYFEVTLGCAIKIFLHFLMNTDVRSCLSLIRHTWTCTPPLDTPTYDIPLQKMPEHEAPGYEIHAYKAPEYDMLPRTPHHLYTHLYRI